LQDIQDVADEEKYAVIQAYFFLILNILNILQYPFILFFGALYV